MPKKYIDEEEAKKAWYKELGITSKRAAIGVDMVFDRIPAADVEEVRHGEWISVKERLPEEDGEYLAGRYGSDEVVIARFTRDCFGMDFRLLDPEKEHRPAFYYEDDEWGTCEWEDVECWMQKPVPPKEAP